MFHRRAARQANEPTSVAAPDAGELRERLAALYADADAKGGLVDLHAADRMRVYINRIVQLTGRTTDDIIATAHADAGLLV